MKYLKFIILLITTLLLVACGSSGGDSGPSVGPTIPVEPPITMTIDGDPVIAFSDMESAPNLGWSKEEPKKGAAITVWGRNFGSARNDSYITVGNVKLTENNDYAVWGEAWPTPFWQKITFFLNSDMLKGNNEITVTVGGKTSNPLPFTIRDGRIFFVKNGVNQGDGTHDKPYSYGKETQYNYINKLQPGDIVYYYEGIYNRYLEYPEYGTLAKYLVSTVAKGSKGNPISFISYPGQKPILKVGSYTFACQAVSLEDYIVMAGFTMEAPHIAASMKNYSRLVGNDIVGLTGHHGNGAGTVQTFHSGAKILGNAIHGGRSKDRLDHAVYFSGAPVDEGSYLGWNYIYDNDFGRGPEIAVNHQGTRIPAGGIARSHYIFNNVVDAMPQRATFVNVFDLGFDPGTGEPDPEPVFIYNNLFLNGGDNDGNYQSGIGDAHALVVTRDHSRIFNNTFYNIAYGGVRFIGNDDEGHYSSFFQNNIIVMNSDVNVYNGNHHYLTDNGKFKKATVTNNIFFDIGNKGVSPYEKLYFHNNPIGPDPKTNHLDKVITFDDVAKKNFTPIGTSFAVDGGINNLTDINKIPSFAPINRDLFFRTRKGNFDIGALEYTK